MDYVHINPVKHGLVKQVADWPYSTFRRLVESIYPTEWVGGNETAVYYQLACGAMPFGYCALRGLGIAGTILAVAVTPPPRHQLKSNGSIE